MRTTKRFTPKVLDRFLRQGRGLGTFHEYRAWHQVGRGDPASGGRSHIEIWKDRQLDLLSDVEWATALFATMVPGVIDIRPQFPLALETSQHELAAYSVDYVNLRAPGTDELARRLAIKHPLVQGAGEKAAWRPTTDLLVTVRTKDELTLLAIAVKPDASWQASRPRELFELEAAYWRAREVRWLLITPAEYCRYVGLTLRRTECWALGTSVDSRHLRIAVLLARSLQGQSERLVLDALTHALGDRHLAQCALWQAIWSGALPIDLDRGYRNHLPLQHVSAHDFYQQNPLVSGRSAWN